MPGKNVLLHVGERTIGPISIIIDTLHDTVTLEDYRDEAITCALEDGELSPEELPFVRASISEA